MCVKEGWPNTGLAALERLLFARIGLLDSVNEEMRSCAGSTMGVACRDGYGEEISDGGSDGR